MGAGRGEEEGEEAVGEEEEEGERAGPGEGVGEEAVGEEEGLRKQQGNSSIQNE